MGHSQPSQYFSSLEPSHGMPKSPQMMSWSSDVSIRPSGQRRCDSFLISMLPWMSPVTQMLMAPPFLICQLYPSPHGAPWQSPPLRRAARQRRARTSSSRPLRHALPRGPPAGVLRTLATADAIAP